MTLLLVIAKVTVTGAVLTALTVAVVHHLRAPEQAAPRAMVQAAAQQAAPRSVLNAIPALAPASGAPAPTLAPPNGVPTLVATVPEHRSAAVPARSTGSGAAAAFDLEDEVAVLDGAREALASGQSDRALSIVNQYERGAAAKTLLLEAQVLRIEALVQRGDAQAAAKLAQAFLAGHASSAHAARVRSLLLATQKSVAP